MLYTIKKERYIIKQIIFNDEIAVKTKYEGYYCTKSGKIISVKVKGGQGKLDFEKPRLHKINEDRDGYEEVCLSYVDENKKHKRLYRRVHRIVWETFNGDIQNDLTVDHINHIRNDNRLENLQLLTRVENGIKRHKNWVEDRRNKYIVFQNKRELGIYNTKQLEDIFNLSYDEIYNYTAQNHLSKKMKALNITLKKV